jgi:predicted DNA-binding transcriptional regulator YafY
MGYGSHAEVLAPQSLREEVAAEAGEVVKLYRGSPEM